MITPSLIFHLDYIHYMNGAKACDKMNLNVILGLVEWNEPK